MVSVWGDFKVLEIKSGGGYQTTITTTLMRDLNTKSWKEKLLAIISELWNQIK